MNKEEPLNLGIDATNHYYQNRLAQLIYQCTSKEEADILAFAIIREAKGRRDEGWERGYKEGIETLQKQMKGILNIKEPPKT